MTVLDEVREVAYRTDGTLVVRYRAKRREDAKHPSKVYELELSRQDAKGLAKMLAHVAETTQW